MSLKITVACLIIGFGFFCLPASYAQPSEKFLQQMQTEDFSFSNNNDILFVLREPVSTILDRNFENAVLVDYKDQAYNTKGCYDAEKDEIHVKLNDKVKTVFPQKVKAVKIGEMVFIPLETKNENTENIGYFQVVSSGKINLLKRYVSKAAKMEREFYSSENNVPLRLHLKKSAVLDRLDSAEVKTFIKTDKPDLKSEEGLKAVFDFYNKSLAKQ